jgi:chemotaxis protein CheD
MNSHNNCPSPVNYFLGPGYIYIPIEPSVISTVLGSCVSVCIYDRKRRKGGMNRFQYPFIGDKRKATSRYGNAATLALIRMMLEDGSKKKNLEAQILGGAFNAELSNQDIGKDNVKIARGILAKEGISLASEDTGGEKGRKIVFNACTNELAVFKVEQLRKADWFPYEGNR